MPEYEETDRISGRAAHLRGIANQIQIGRTEEREEECVSEPADDERWPQDPYRPLHHPSCARAGKLNESSCGACHSPVRRHDEPSSSIARCHRPAASAGRFASYVLLLVRSSVRTRSKPARVA